MINRIDITDIERMQNALLRTAEAIIEGRAWKLHAILCYRAATGSGLKEAKDWVESAVQIHDRFSQLEARVGVIERNAGKSD